MVAALLRVVAVLGVARAAWGPRDALLKHEGEHREQHARAAATASLGDAAGDAGLAHLAAVVADHRSTVAAIKKTKVDMYGDAGAIAAVTALQEATRELLFARYGRAAAYVLEIDVTYPASLGGESATVTLETAPVALMPHAIHVFLDAALEDRGEKRKGRARDTSQLLRLARVELVFRDARTVRPRSPEASTTGENVPDTFRSGALRVGRYLESFGFRAGGAARSIGTRATSSKPSSGPRPTSRASRSRSTTPRSPTKSLRSASRDGREGPSSTFRRFRTSRITGRAPRAPRPRRTRALPRSWPASTS